MPALSIALNRFGLGARPDAPMPTDAKSWLTAQLDGFEVRPASIAALPPRREIAEQLARFLEQVRQQQLQNRVAGAAAAAPPRPVDQMNDSAQGTPAAPLGLAGRQRQQGRAVTDEPGDAGKTLRRNRRLIYADAVGARTLVAVQSATPFVERMVHFWANHFAVSVDKPLVLGLTGNMEFEAIRPHVLGKFSDMLNAVERHPAMLLYLDQAQSVGPNSPLGSRVGRNNPQRKVGLNENLAREILELHTLGVRTGYSQADVTEFARAMTGWTVAGIARGPGARFAGAQGQPGDFVFAPPLHEPGSRSIMGRRYGEGGERQAQAVLDMLAAHPATAQHIATKLARHFAGDAPPPALVARLKANFMATGGDLPSLYKTLVDSPELWGEAPTKFRSPWEWAVGAMRALNLREVRAMQITGLMNQLGQPVWGPGSPAGYDDLAVTWAGPDAIVRRVEVAGAFAARVAGRVDARTLAARLYPAAVSAPTAAALANAESPDQALALLLVAPETLRR
ncbi:MAG: DUF1800 family protein [Sphingomonas sp.]